MAAHPNEADRKNQELKPRRYGEGSIRWDAKRKKYRITVDMARPGEKADPVRRFRATAREAEEVAYELLAAKKKGQRAARRLTLERWMHEWLEMSDHKPSTRTDHRSKIKLYIAPSIGKVQVADLDPEHVRRLHEYMRKKGLSPTTIMHAHHVAGAAMSEAVRLGKSQTNPFALVKAPRKAQGVMQVMRSDEQARFEEAISGRADEARWQVAIHLGIRQGEALGMTWENVRLEHKTPHVALHWSLQHVRYRCGCGATSPCPQPGRRCPRPLPDIPPGRESRRLIGAYHLLPPKSTSSRRVLPLPSWMIDPMERRRDAVAAERERADFEDYDLVWARPNGRPLSKDADSGTWHRLLDEASVRSMPLHAARHSAASALMRKGADPKAIQAILGHSSYVTTMGYQHADLDYLTTALETVRPH